MKKENQERVLLHREEGMIKTAQMRIESTLPYLQTMVDEAKKVQLTITGENFTVASGKSEKWAKKEYTAMLPEETVSLGAFKLKKVDRLESLELPDLLGFTSAAANFANFVRTNQVPVNLLTVEDGTAKLDTVEMEKFVEQHSRFISHPTSKKVMEEFHKVFDQINSFNELLLKECSSSGIDRLNFAHYATQKPAGLVPSLDKMLELTHRFENSKYIDI